MGACTKMVDRSVHFMLCGENRKRLFFPVGCWRREWGGGRCVAEMKSWNPVDHRCGSLRVAGRAPWLRLGAGRAKEDVRFGFKFSGIAMARAAAQTRRI